MIRLILLMVLVLSFGIVLGNEKLRISVGFQEPKAKQEQSSITATNSESSKVA